VGSNNHTVVQSNSNRCKYAAYISIIVNIGTIKATAYPSEFVRFGGAVKTVAAVAIVAVLFYMKKSEHIMCTNFATISYIEKYELT